MIKFNCAIHKGTGTIITYDEWLKEIQEQDSIVDRPVEKQMSENEILSYRPKQILFSDNFLIIYNSEFTIEELKLAKECIGMSISENVGDDDLNKECDLENKIRHLINEKMILKSNLNVEV